MNLRTRQMSTLPEPIAPPTMPLTPARPSGLGHAIIVGHGQTQTAKGKVLSISPRHGKCILYHTTASDVDVPATFVFQSPVSIPWPRMLAHTLLKPTLVQETHASSFVPLLLPAPSLLDRHLSLPASNQLDTETLHLIIRPPFPTRPQQSGFSPRCLPTNANHHSNATATLSMIPSKDMEVSPAAPQR